MDDPVLQSIVSFVQTIGLPVKFAPILDATTLPGIRIDHGTLVVDRSRLLAAGDILHEAGHLAVMEPKARSETTGPLEASPADEMMAIAWSYAAAVHLSLAPSVVFHPDGYKGGAQALVENFSEGRYIGVPMLAWIGLSVDPGRPNASSVAPYPHMLRWLRDFAPPGTARGE